jgi:hypothetical protein
MKRPHLLFSLLLGTADLACRGAPTVATPLPDSVPEAAPPQSSASAGARIPDGSRDAGLAAQRGPLPWGARPAPGSELSYVIDGYCVLADVDLLPNATLVHYGEHSTGYVAHVTDEGLDEMDRLSRGLDGKAAGYKYGDIRGTYPDNMWFELNNGGRASTFISYAKFEVDHWALALGPKNDGDLTQYRALVTVPGGALAATLTCDENACRGGPIVGKGVTAPPLGDASFGVTRILPFASGEVWAFGALCDADRRSQKCTAQARRWKPGAKVSFDTLGAVDYELTLSSLIGSSPDDVTLSFATPAGASRNLHFDGTRWSPVSWPGKIEGGELHAAPDGSVWSIGASGKIERRAGDGSLTDISLPRALVPFGRGPALDGVEVGAPWAALDDGTVVRFVTRNGRGVWTKVEIPRSPFAWSESKVNFPKAEGVRVRSDKDAWVNVKYFERPLHYGAEMYEERRALLRTITPAETLRCKNGFESSPPLATPDCTTPLVLVETVDSRTPTEWTRGRRLLAGKKDLEGTTLIEVTAGKHKVLAARVPSYEVGKKALMILRAAQPTAMPEMVCAAPEGARDVPFDLAAGKR